MQHRQLTSDTEAHVCISCGRDDMPRRTATNRDQEDDTPLQRKQRTTGLCKVCKRLKPLRVGLCARCQARIDNGIQAV